jgi:acyl-CoA synthetase (AMP-forming)/AMP-acid ligase II
MTTFRGPPLETEEGIGALTLPGFLLEVTERHADREAVVFHDPDAGVTRWSYADLAREAHRVAKALVATGVDKGTHVALLLGNRPEWVAAAYGIGLAGGVAVPVNTYYEPPELEHVLRHSDAAVVLTQPRLARHCYVEQIEAMRERLPYLRDVVALGSGWDAFLAAGDAVSDELVADRAACVTPGDPALIVYTSGTTAEAKGILHAHRGPALQSWRFVRHLALGPDDRVWSAFPFFWSAGFAMVMGGTLAAGGCLVLQERFDPEDALRLIEVERVTAPFTWPHQAAELEEHPAWAGADLSSVVKVTDFGPFARHPSVRIPGPWSSMSAYGLSETCTIITSLPADTPPEERDGCEGLILPGNEIRILHPQTHDALGPGEIGDIAVRGPTLMEGYVKALRDECFDAEGFFRTGDAGYVDRDWRFHWTGRTSEMIKTGGANVSPWEIELALLRHPGLKAAKVVGVPHPTLGEIVVVCAVAHDDTAVDEEDVRDFLRGTLAIYKIPRHVLFVEEEELSLTGNAKIRVDALRALALQRL